MALKVQRKVDSQGLTQEQIVAEFRTALENNSSCYTKSEIEELAALHAKTPTDNFVVSDEDAKRRSIKQGDILIHGVESKFYKQVAKSIDMKNARPAENTNLQEGKAITGDHRVVPLKGAKLEILDTRFKPVDDRILGGRPYPCKIIKSDKPFALTHQEHGNMTFPAGEYMSFVALDPKTQNRIID